MWRWRRYALYRVVCLYVCMYVLPTFLKNYWTKLHEIFSDDWSSSKDQLIRFLEQSCQRSRSRSRKGQKRIFSHNSLSFCPIHMKPTPKCLLFNSLSSDMVTDVALAKVCTIQSAHSSPISVFRHRSSKRSCHDLRTRQQSYATDKKADRKTNKPTTS